VAYLNVPKTTVLILRQPHSAVLSLSNNEDMTIMTTDLRVYGRQCCRPHLQYNHNTHCLRHTHTAKIL